MSHSIIIIQGKRILGKIYIEAREEIIKKEQASAFFKVKESQLEGIETLIERGRTLGSSLTITEYRAIARLSEKCDSKKGMELYDFSKETFYIALNVSNTTD